VVLQTCGHNPTGAAPPVLGDGRGAVPGAAVQLAGRRAWVTLPACYVSATAVRQPRHQPQPTNPARLLQASTPVPSSGRASWRCASGASCCPSSTAPTRDLPPATSRAMQRRCGSLRPRAWRCCWPSRTPRTWVYTASAWVGGPGPGVCFEEGGVSCMSWGLPPGGRGLANLGAVGGRGGGKSGRCWGGGSLCGERVWELLACCSRVSAGWHMGAAQERLACCSRVPAGWHMGAAQERITQCEVCAQPALGGAPAPTSSPAGALSIVAASPGVSQRIESQLKAIIRCNYSSPPVHGAALVTTILRDPQVRRGRRWAPRW